MFIKYWGEGTRMNRSGQGISINVVIIAAIALLILVILSVLVIRSTQKVNEGTQCSALGGQCVNVNDFGGRCDFDGALYQDRGGFCPRALDGANQICCRRL
jgi:hypothetical protein